MGDTRLAIARVALNYQQPHPDTVLYPNACLWSINERLGALCEVMGARSAGADIPRFTGRYLSDLLELAKRDANEQEYDPTEGAIPFDPSTMKHLLD